MEYKNFKLSQFDCKHCGENKMDWLFLSQLDEAMTRAKFTNKINSGYRCEVHNAAVGSTSLVHPAGVAADIACGYGAGRMTLVRALILAGFKRIGIAKDFVHVDSYGGGPSLWLYPPKSPEIGKIA